MPPGKSWKCGHSVLLVLLHGTVYQQTLKLHRHLQTLNIILRHICLFDPTMHPVVPAVDFERALVVTFAMLRHLIHCRIIIIFIIIT